MTTARMPSSRPHTALRRAAVVLAASAAIVLNPVPHAQASPADAAAPAAASAAAASPAAQVVVNTALAQQGKPYAWAGAGPHSFDCSGLTQYAYAAAGVALPHSSRAQATMGVPVSRNALQPGDLVAFYSPVGHIGIYIGNGQIVHAPTSGSVVKVVNLDYMPSFNTARRLV